MEAVKNKGVQCYKSSKGAQSTYITTGKVVEQKAEESDLARLTTILAIKHFSK